MGADERLHVDDFYQALYAASERGHCLPFHCHVNFDPGHPERGIGEGRAFQKGRMVWAKYERGNSNSVLGAVVGSNLQTILFKWMFCVRSREVSCN